MQRKLGLMIFSVLVLVASLVAFERYVYKTYIYKTGGLHLPLQN